METFLVGIRMSLWPLFQSEMGAHVDSLKALADSATGSMFARGNVRDPVVRAVRYVLDVCSTLITQPGCTTLCNHV